VSLYQRFSNGRAIFLLESAALGDETGRYSFIGLDRKWRVTTHGATTVVQGVDVSDVDNHGPMEVLRALLGRYRTFVPEDLPDFFGGAVGFVTYDYVRRLERLPRVDVDGMWPDVDFSFPGAVLICDHLRHSTTVVVNAVIESGDDPSDIYATASAQLRDIVEVLISPPPPADEATERLVATAPSSKSSIDIRAIAAGLSNFSQAQYEQVVVRAKEYIYAGDVFQVVPSQQFRRPTSVNPLTLYRVLRALNPSPYMYLLDTGESQIVGASPVPLRAHDRAAIRQAKTKS
jgi:anthranilate synthase component 1